MPLNFENREDDPDYWNRRRYRHRQAGLVPAIVLISVGAIFLLNNLHIFYFQDVWRYWPTILIAIGLVKLVDSQNQSGRTSGAILLVLGAIFLVPNLGFWDVSIGQLWPLFLIGLGVILLSQRVVTFQAGASGTRSFASVPGALNEHAVFSGGRRRVVTPNFLGGEMSAIFGGFDIDLRKAGMAGDSAVLVLNAIFGGMDVRVPESWDVSLEISAIFGGCDDKTVHPDPSQPGVKRLILRGSAIFGGIDVKN